MRKYEIFADVSFKVHWVEPATNPSEIILRDMAQIRLDRKAHDFSEALKTLLTLTTLDSYEDM